MRQMILLLRPLVTPGRIRLPEGVRRELALWRWRRVMGGRWARTKPAPWQQREYW
ncbi:MAG: hypothetical protein HY217_11750 [Candidatus Rokubacteria bacterium]|nr:hypothetical protein [Candidatus Rokubacteria bacterium]